GRPPLRHLVDVAQRRDARAEVQKLAHATTDKKRDGTPKERPVGLHDPCRVRDRGRHATCHLPVDREVVRAPEPVVVDPCRTRLIDVNALRHPVGPAHPCSLAVKAWIDLPAPPRRRLCPPRPDLRAITQSSHVLPEPPTSIRNRPP